MFNLSAYFNMTLNYQKKKKKKSGLLNNIFPQNTIRKYFVFQYVHGSWGCWDDGDVFSLHGDGPGDVELGG